MKPNDKQLVFTLPEALIEIRDLRSQRDELLSALKDLEDYASLKCLDHQSAPMKKARATLTSATGSAS